jgi:hypothetical protein
MSSLFTHGYALLVGVGQSRYPGWSLPVTVKDAQTLHAILTDPNLCAYPNDEDHIHLLHDAGATRAAILDGLAWLQAQPTVDLDATVVVYYSGHGWLDRSTGEYYLLPHDIEPFDIPSSALSARAFIDVLRGISARRLLVFIDSCHAQGMAMAKDEPKLKLPSGFVQVALPKGVIDDLKQGEGRAVFTSSRGEQRSWVRRDGSLSIYTYHLIEALQGAGNQPGDNLVRLSNLMNHLSKTVPESARRLCQAEQTPFFDTATEDFPVAILRGGKGLPAGGWGAVEGESAETIRRISTKVVRTTIHGSVSGSTVVTAGGDVKIGKLD